MSDLKQGDLEELWNFFENLEEDIKITKCVNNPGWSLDTSSLGCFGDSPLDCLINFMGLRGIK